MAHFSLSLSCSNLLGFVCMRVVILRPTAVNSTFKQFYSRLCTLASSGTETVSAENRKILADAVALFNEPIGFSLFDFGLITRQTYNQVFTNIIVMTLLVLGLVRKT